jgi:hypothetical protein
MFSKILCLTLFSASLNVTAASADGAAAPAPVVTHGGIRISIKNEYDVALNFGPLGHGTRNGNDRVEGVLKRQGSEYVGIVNGVVVSTQTMAGLMGSCGPGHYEDSQKLQVTGRPVDGFNTLVQSVTFNQAAPGGLPANASNEYLVLEFVPETRTTQQPQVSDPGKDQIVNCHTLIETQSGDSFLPLNDSRWTMPGGGYIIVLPSAGVLDYTDDTVAAGSAAPLGPFQAKKSIWTIQVERLP